MLYGRESTGPGPRRRIVNARNLDLWRSDCFGGRVLSSSEIEYFHKLRDKKEPTPTELVYRKLLQQREK